ncbi:MAG: DUF3307 domain-containing protein [Bacilli bacterium]|nr:DUF3307 domain-containing protein [Bacilli bacterium]
MMIFILAHILTDFILQKDSHIEKKLINNLKENLVHSIKVLISFLLGGILFVFLMNINCFMDILRVLIFVFINAISHFLIDITKTKASKKNKISSLILLLVDQAIHVVILVVSYRFLLSDYLTVYPGSVYINLLVFISIATFVSSVFIREILDLFNLHSKRNLKQYNDIQNLKIVESKNDSKQNCESNNIETVKNLNIGKWIGIIERIIMFLSLYLNVMGLLTIVVAFKTLSRYEKFKDNGEYYIIGNLLSILFVLLSYGIFLIAN